MRTNNRCFSRYKIITILPICILSVSIFISTWVCPINWFSIDSTNDSTRSGFLNKCLNHKFTLSDQFAQPPNTCLTKYFSNSYSSQYPVQIRKILLKLQSPWKLCVIEARGKDNSQHLALPHSVNFPSEMFKCN